jgi:hypothetical protein
MTENSARFSVLAGPIFSISATGRKRATVGACAVARSVGEYAEGRNETPARQFVRPVLGDDGINVPAEKPEM